MRKYDLVCSLGGNCAAAHNLLYRNLRRFSLPFDWLYILDDKPLYNLADCFKNDFKYFCLKENFKPLPEGLNTSHLDKTQYYETYTGYRFVNHFSKSIEDGGYEDVKEKMDRRIKRLYKYIGKSKKILFILSVPFEIEINALQELLKVLSDKWSDKIFEIEVIMFNCLKEIISGFPNITVRKYKRTMNNDDFEKTNPKWAFLDDICLNETLYHSYIGYNRLMKILFCVIPFKSLRKKLRKKYYV